MEQKFLLLVSVVCTSCLLFTGCETIATKEDIGVVEHKVSNVQDDFYTTSKVISERLQNLETNTNERFSSVSENLIKEKAVISSQISLINDDIRKLYGKIDEIDYKFTEEMKKDRASVEQKDFEIRRDMEGLKKTYSDIIASISLLSKNLSSIQNDMLVINQAQIKIAESLNNISADVEKSTVKINLLEEKIGKNIQVFLDEITRQESEIFSLKQEVANLKSELNITEDVSPVKTEDRSQKLSSTSTSRYYTVKKGDTLGKIASQFKTTEKTIMEVNKLKKDTVYIGQKLIIP